ncbi:MAG: flagella basal body P-ring formation protein FlgA [Leptospirales bacterium]|nr:flagella basal body P-ring formation protein FlgA [Leptospirales bacterium]
MKVLLAICFVLFGSAVFADVQIYLYSSVNKGEERLKIKDIARVEALNEERSLFEEIEIDDDAILMDTYIDRRELFLLLKEKTKSNFVIYGSSVKVFDGLSPPKERFSVKRGERIKVLVKKKDITIELTGVAIKDAADGSQITVRCGKKEINGIVSNKTVICEL